MKTTRYLVSPIPFRAWRSLRLYDRRVRVSLLRTLKLCLSRVLLAGTLVLPMPGLGKSSDAEQPVHVEADSAELNQTTGVGIYRGDVRITQGSMVLTADVVTVIAPGEDLQKLIAEGDRASFRQLTDAGDEITAYAQHMEYAPDKNRITLLNNAVLRRATDRFKAERIVYHIDRQIVDAGDPQGQGRVKMTLVPEDDGEAD
jgi:lipopolysaccharide export system protein LptA